MQSAASDAGKYLFEKFDQAGSAVGEWFESITPKGNAPENHKTSGSSNGGIEFTKTNGRTAGSSPIQSTEHTEHRDITAMSDMKGLSPPGGSPAAKVVEKVKEIGGIVNTGIDALQTNPYTPLTPASTPYTKKADTTVIENKLGDLNTVKDDSVVIKINSGTTTETKTIPLK